MSRRNTISREFFATIAAVLVLGLSVMCAIQTALSAAHFISERKSSLTDVLNGATALSERFADEGSVVTRPLQGEDLVERAHSGFELFNTTSGALIFIADKTAASCCTPGTRPSPARMCRPITLHSLMKAAIFLRPVRWTACTTQNTTLPGGVLQSVGRTATCLPPAP